MTLFDSRRATAAVLLFCFSILAWDLTTTAFGGATFEKTKIILGKVVLKAEVADTEERREYGLMNRSSLKDGEGMIFIFEKARQQSFWMKDTLIPLSIGFFDEGKKLFQITDMEPASPIDKAPSIYNSVRPAKFALEVPKGWFKRKNVRLGTKLQLPELKF